MKLCVNAPHLRTRIYTQHTQLLRPSSRTLNCNLCDSITIPNNNNHTHNNIYNNSALAPHRIAQAGTVVRMAMHQAVATAHSSIMYTDKRISTISLHKIRNIIKRVGAQHTQSVHMNMAHGTWTIIAMPQAKAADTATLNHFGNDEKCQCVNRRSRIARVCGRVRMSYVALGVAILYLFYVFIRDACTTASVFLQ